MHAILLLLGFIGPLEGDKPGLSTPPPAEQPRVAEPKPLTDEDRRRLDEIIAKGEKGAVPRLARPVWTLAEARVAGRAADVLARNMTWGREYRGWFVFTYEMPDGSPCFSLHGVAIQKGSRNVRTFGVW